MPVIKMHGQFALICGNPTPELFDFLGKFGSHKYPNKRSRKYFILDFFCRANSKIDWRFWSRKGYKNASMYIMVKIFAWDKPWAQVNWQKNMWLFTNKVYTFMWYLHTKKNGKKRRNAKI